MMVGDVDSNFACMLINALHCNMLFVIVEPMQNKKSMMFDESTKPYI